MDIKLPVPIIDAKTMLSFSTWNKLHHKKLLYKCLFSTYVLIQDFQVLNNQKMNLMAFQHLWEPCVKNTFKCDILGVFLLRTVYKVYTYLYVCTMRAVEKLTIKKQKSFTSA